MTLADRAEANHLALIHLAKWFANVLFLCFLATSESRFSRASVRVEQAATSLSRNWKLAC